jgi:DNA-binding MarR family transcriptional regulator
MVPKRRFSFGAGRECDCPGKRLRDSHIFKVTTWRKLGRLRLFDAVGRDLQRRGYPSQIGYDVLDAISVQRTGSLRPGEIERSTALRQYAVSRAVTQLAGEGLVRRRRLPDDRRGYSVEITEVGRRSLAEMWEAYSAALEMSVGTTPRDHVAFLRSIAAKLSGP